jgi:phosphohistidine phosphatase
MLLYLVQHGEPKSKEEDPERPLSDKGRLDVQKAAYFLLSIGPPEIFHSGKLRARQTAGIFGGKFGVGAKEADALGPLDAPSVWAGRLREKEGDAMLVGHLPHMGRLASLLLCGDSEAGIVEFRQGGVLCLKREEGRWAVRWMVVPEIIAQK